MGNILWKFFQGIRKVQNILTQTKLNTVHEKGNIKDQFKGGFISKKTKEKDENKLVKTKFFKIT